MPMLKYLTRDEDQHRAKLMHKSGYTLWVCMPILDGWWVPKLRTKNNAYVEVSKADAKSIAGRTLTPGEMIPVALRCDDEGGIPLKRLVPCPMEARLNAQERG